MHVSRHRLASPATAAAEGPGIQLTPDVWQQFDLPIIIPENATVAIEGTDETGLGVRPIEIDWGGAMNLIQIDGGATLAFEHIVSKRESKLCEALLAGWLRGALACCHKPCRPNARPPPPPRPQTRATSLRAKRRCS